MFHPPQRGSQDMSEPEKPKRKFWQFHLSTTVMSLLAVSVFMFANLHRVGIERIKFYQGLGVWENTTLKFNNLGWPLPFMRYCTSVQEEPSASEVMNSTKKDFILRSLIADIVIGVLIALVVAIACEWLARRREGRKP
jgi:hypothetical protein